MAPPSSDSASDEEFFFFGAAYVQWSVITGPIMIRTRVRIATCPILIGTGQKPLPFFFFFWPCHACRPHTNLKYKHEFFRQSKQNCWENVTQLGFSWVPHFRGLLFINMLSVWSPSVTGKIYYIWLYVPSFLPYTKCNPCDIEEYISYIR